MILIVSKYLVPKGYQGLTIFPFVFAREKSLKHNLVFINHEKIHLKQQLELLLIPFYIWYVLEFLLNFLHFKKVYLAYKNICFEQEAYANENNLKYLKTRPFWAFLKFSGYEKT